MKITFVGDIMSEKVQNEKCFFNGKYDYEGMFDEKIREYLNKSDYVIGNLETPIAGEKAGFSNEKYSFNTPEELLKTLKNIGVDALSTANNHCLDRGIDGLVETMRAIKRNELEYFGTFETKNQKRFSIKTIKRNQNCFFILHLWNKCFS